jgi:hypothetical protein
MHEYTVEFRIHGTDLNVPAVTHELGLRPSLVRLVGERRDENTQWKEAMWSYDGFPESEGSKSWSSLEEGLDFVLKKLWPFRDRIGTFGNKHKVILWCGHFQSTLDGGPTLSPGMLKRLGDFGVALYLENHFCDVPTEEGGVME